MLLFYLQILNEKFDLFDENIIIKCYKIYLFALQFRVVFYERIFFLINGDVTKFVFRAKIS